MKMKMKVTIGSKIITRKQYQYRRRKTMSLCNSNAITVLFTGIVIYLVAATAQAKYSGGFGDPNAPYLIATPDDLNTLGHDPNMASFINFKTIGYYNWWDDQKPFTGVFDGNHFTIANLTYFSMGTEMYVGLFGRIKSGAEIRNLGLIDPNIRIPNSMEGVGALVGDYGATLIINCYVTGGNIAGTYSVGGLIGKCQGEVRNCYTQTHTEGSYHVGGLCGLTGYAFVSDCHTKGIVNGKYSTGGLIGLNYRSEIRKCFSDVSVAGESITGGLVGRNGNDAKIYNCCSTGIVNGLDICGGLVGANRNDLETALISNCYSSAAVTGDSDYGALIGVQQGGSETISSFWDVNVNPSLDGISNSPSDPNVIGLPTELLQQRSTFAGAGWDMVKLWDVGEGQTYPFLRKHLPGDINKDDETNLFDLGILADNWLADTE